MKFRKIILLFIALQFIYSVSNAQIKLLGHITTNGIASYPTHIDILGQGGYMSMPTIADRDAIPTLRRKYGMLVFVQADGVIYKLNAATLANAAWVPFSLPASEVDAGTLTGTTLKSTVTGSSLTSVGTLGNLTVTNPIVGSITGNAATATTANAGTLTGTTLNSTVTGSSLTSVGRLVSLDVNGAATNTTAFNAAASTTIDFTKSNLAYTSNNPSSFTLSGIKDGGTYTLAVQGTTSGTSAFLSGGFTFMSVNNGPTTSGKQTLYTFIVMGTTVYFFMTTGF